MASSRALLACLLLLLALHLAHSGHVISGEPQLKTSTVDLPAQVSRSRYLETTAASALNCAGACAARCSRSWKPKMCNRMCGACCGRCGCVPSGTGVETRAACPCYANMRNPKGKLKCP